MSLALVQNRHTDAILAPALYTNLSGAPCVCVFAFACVFVHVCVCVRVHSIIFRYMAREAVSPRILDLEVPYLVE